MSKEEGLILSGHYLPDGLGKEKKSHPLEYWGVGRSGPFCLHFDDTYPLLFVESGRNLPSVLKTVKVKELGLKTFASLPVTALYFESTAHLLEARDILSKEGIRTFEGDISAVDRYLMERGPSACVVIEGDVSKEKGVRHYFNPKIYPGSFIPELKILSLDIETSMQGELFAVAFHGTGSLGDEKIVCMVGDSTHQGEHILEDGARLFYFSSERELLESVLVWWEHFDPDVLIGWHIIGFDLSFLQQKALQVGLDFALGKDRTPVLIREWGPRQFIASMKGRIVLDGPPLLRFMGKKYSNFKLDTVAGEVLGLSKDITGDTDKVQEIERRFREDKVALAKYNLLDTILVTQIFDRLQVIPFALHYSRVTGVPLDRLHHKSLMLDYQILPRLHRMRWVAPNVLDLKTENEKEVLHKIIPAQGMVEQVCVFRFTHFWPSWGASFKVDPLGRMLASKEGFKTESGQKNPSGVFFSKDTHPLSDVLTDFLQREKEHSTEEGQSMAYASAIDHMFGQIFSSNCRFYSREVLETLKSIGRWFFSYLENFLSELGYQILAVSEDHLFIKLKDSDRGQVFQRAEYLVKKINQYFKDRLDRDYKTSSFFEVELSRFYYKVFFPMEEKKSTQKSYAGLYLEQGQQHFDFVGLDLDGSDSVSYAEIFQEKILKAVLSENNLQEILKTEIQNLKNGLYDDFLFYRKKLQPNLNLKDQPEKNMQPHVRAATLLTDLEFAQLFKTGRREITYIMTRKGPVPTQRGPLEKKPSHVDYDHYIDKQIRPIADQILPFYNLSLDDILLGDQMGLFDFM